MEAASFTAPVAPTPTGAPKPYLKRGAIGYLSNIVIGVASTAPGYSLAAAIGFIVLVNGVGAHMPAVIFVSAIPMFAIAGAYKQMNRVDPDCGTTFSWMTRAMGAGWGFMGGWAILFASIVVNANQAQIAGSYGFQLVGFGSGVYNNKYWVMLLGVVFISALTWICWKGIELSARTQQLLLGFEITTLLVFGVVAFIKSYANHPAHSVNVSLDWFNPFKLGTGPLLTGMLIGVFLYWGWDTGVAVNEETRDSATAPGKAALTSNVVLIATFLFVAVAAQSFAGSTYLGANANDIFAGGLASGVLGGLHFLLTIAVLTSATAATQTTILPAARQALSMSRRGAIPTRFSEIHPRNLVPARATIWAGVLSVIWFIIIEYLSTNVLADCVSGLGFLVCFYYGFTGLACVIFYRREITKSAHNVFRYLIGPMFGFVVLMIILVKGAIYYADAANTTSGKGFLGIGVPDWIGILGFGSGIALMLVSRRFRPAFFRNEKRLKYGDHFEPVTPEAEFAPAESML
jgi:amino acid transporter